MPIETIEFNGVQYPMFQTNGNASRFCRPFALEVLKDCETILDICPNRLEWSFPNSILIDTCIDDEFDAMNLPDVNADAIHCSHGLEHLERPFDVLEYWHSKLKKGGKIFLYLPNMDTQLYHRPWSNKKHLWYCNDIIMKNYFNDRSDLWVNSFISSGSDLYNSFMCFAEKK